MGEAHQKYRMLNLDLVSGCRNQMEVLLGVKSFISMSSESNMSCVRHKEHVGGPFRSRGQFFLAEWSTSIITVIFCKIRKSKFMTVLTVTCACEGGAPLHAYSFIHSFLWHVQNATIPCHSQELLPFLSVMYFFLPLFSTNYLSILFHLILPSISWSTSHSCSQIHI